MRLGKTEMIAALVATGLSRQQAERAVEGLLKSMHDTLASPGGSVVLLGICTINSEAQDRQERSGFGGSVQVRRRVKLRTSVAKTFAMPTPEQDARALMRAMLKRDE